MLIHNSIDLAVFCNEVRKEKKLSQAQVSSSVGLKQTTLSKFELRPESTKLETVFRILSALDLEIEVLVKQKTSSASHKEWKEEW